MRYAIIENPGQRLGAVQRYMPGNYSAVQAGDGILIHGEDSAGWTLDGYVLPRLASGLIFARELLEAPEGAR